MKKIFLLFFFLTFAVSPHAFAQQKIPILLYHSIGKYPGHGLKGLYVTTENFEKQMTYLKKNGFTFLTFERWQDRQKVAKPIFITFDDGYENNLNAFTVFQKLKDDHFAPAATIFVISDFVGRPNRLTASELKNLSDSGYFSIQSHTATHPHLTKTNNYEYELKNSKDKIEKITRRPVFTLAYPYGSYNARVIKETKKYYRFGLTDSSEPHTPQGVDDGNYLLPRTYIYYSTTLEEFKQLVN
jgi:peptidoglycan/xylan/chitin deacetylase (PgdA/CDA1 family)